jgi:O-acetyl-ADP-ribose deacetylase (regulator of RNase III)
MIKFLNGDLFTSKADIIAHQVNCKGVMGSGVALQVKNRFPYVYKNYRQFVNTNFPCLGKCLIVVTEEVVIANLFAQDNYGYNKVFTDYKALASSLNSLSEQMKSHNFSSVAFPDMIGCGLAGGNRDTVLKLIEKILSDFEVEFWKFQ